MPAPVVLPALTFPTAIQIKWDEVAGASHYNIYRSTASPFTPADPPYVTVQPAQVAGVNSFVDSHVASGTNYFYVVIAVDGFGNKGLASAIINGRGTGGGTPSQFSQVNTAFSATPTFTSTLGPSLFTITLTGNVTSSTLVVNAPAPVLLAFEIIQDSVGGRTFVWPTNVANGALPGLLPNSKTFQLFMFDGTNAYPLGPATTN